MNFVRCNITRAYEIEGLTYEGNIIYQYNEQGSLVKKFRFIDF